MRLATVDPYASHPSEANKYANKVFDQDVACFFAYIPSLRALSAEMPLECKRDQAKITSDLNTAKQQDNNAAALHVCLALAGHNAKHIAQCNDGRYATKAIAP